MTATTGKKLGFRLPQRQGLSIPTAPRKGQTKEDCPTGGQPRGGALRWLARLKSLLQIISMKLGLGRRGETDENHDAIATGVTGKVDIDIRFPVVD